MCGIVGYIGDKDAVGVIVGEDTARRAVVPFEPPQTVRMYGGNELKTLLFFARPAQVRHGERALLVLLRLPRHETNLPRTVRSPHAGR